MIDCTVATETEMEGLVNRRYTYDIIKLCVFFVWHELFNLDK